MIADNPHIRKLDRAPYEFGRLVAMMPSHMPRDRALTADEQQMVGAALAHAGTAIDNISHGLEAIGAVLFSACENDDFPPEPRHLGALGVLVRHLAVEAQFIREHEEVLRADLLTHEHRTAPTRKGASA